MNKHDINRSNKFKTALLHFGTNNHPMNYSDSAAKFYDGKHTTLGNVQALLKMSRVTLTNPDNHGIDEYDTVKPLDLNMKNQRVRYLSAEEALQALFTITSIYNTKHGIPNRRIEVVSGNKIIDIVKERCYIEYREVIELMKDKKNKWRMVDTSICDDADKPSILQILK